MTAKTTPISNITRELGEMASQHYEEARNDISRVKESIELNRKGQLSIAEMQVDEERWERRVERAGAHALERINGTADFQEIETVAKLMRLAESVCKINIRSRYKGMGSGTGFLIGQNLIITNNHVLPSQDIAQYSTAQFNYELDALGNPKPTFTFRLDPEKFFTTSSYKRIDGDHHSGLDYTIVAITDVSQEGKSIADFYTSKLDQTLGKIVDGESCVVIQHPRGDFKKVVLKDIRSLICKDHFLIYESDTLPGSSGSMVVGLGTGEVVALHHSGVPRKNRHGQWLRKDGSVVQPGDSDEDIDWIGNEGIRVSSILKSLKEVTLPSNMQSIRNSLFEAHPLDNLVQNGKPKTPMQNSLDSQARSSNQLQETFIRSFELELSDVSSMQEDWHKNCHRLVPGLVSVEPLYPLSTDPSHRRLYYIKVNTSENPWIFASKIEDKPQVLTCTPDLEMLTDVQAEFRRDTNNGMSATESFSDGVASWDENESAFKTKWIYAKHTKNFIREPNEDGYRKWNHDAVNYEPDILNHIQHLSKIDIVQLDTGYSDHQKVKNNFDLKHDEDFIDGEDARDEFTRGILRHPGHGTRTASILIGRQSERISNDGNHGILNNISKNESIPKVIPYRIAQSVVLLNRGRNLFDAALHAINSGADIMFLCMGSYPRPMLYSIAKTAYLRGVIWVCAAGNEVESVVAPAVYPGTIAVAASNPDDRPWKGSSYGDAVDIAAPGEDVYVPFNDRHGNDIMAFGSGTSYATPHVAAAAALWKAKFYDDLITLSEPWRIVERFRMCLRLSANRLPKQEGNEVENTWDERYGAGILDMKLLLSRDLYDQVKGKEVNAYKEVDDGPTWDLGVREVIHFVWQTLRKKLTPGHESFVEEFSPTDRARLSLEALSPSNVDSLESSDNISESQATHLIKTYFESFSSENQYHKISTHG